MIAGHTFRDTSSGRVCDCGVRWVNIAATSEAQVGALGIAHVGALNAPAHLGVRVRCQQGRAVMGLNLRRSRNGNSRNAPFATPAAASRPHDQEPRMNALQLRLLLVVAHAARDMAPTSVGTERLSEALAAVEERYGEPRLAAMVDVTGRNP